MCGDFAYDQVKRRNSVGRGLRTKVIQEDCHPEQSEGSRMLAVEGSPPGKT